MLVLFFSTINNIKFYLNFILFLISLNTLGQILPEYTLNIKKHHKGDITDIVINKDSNEIISADSRGNVLVHNLSNYKYIRSLNLTSSEEIHSIRLINNNKDLIINYFDDYTKKGALCFYNLKKNVVYNIIKGNYQITNPNGESLIAVAKNDTKLILYNKSPFMKIDSISTKRRTLTSTISFNKKLIATLEEVNSNPGPKGINGPIEIKTLTIYDLNLKKELNNIKFTDKNKIPSAVLFEKESLLCLTSRQQSNYSELLRIDLNDFKVKKLKSYNFYTSRANAKIVSNNRKKILVFSDEGSWGYSDCIIFDLNSKYYSIYLANLEFQYSIGIFNEYLSEYFFVHGLSLNGKKVTDKNFNSIEKNLSVKEYIKSKSVFISNDNWITFSTSPGNDNLFSLKKKGTLFNSFFKKEKLTNLFFKSHKLNIKPYYERFNENMLDKEKSVIGYSDIDKINNQLFYTRYDLLNERKQKICKKNKGENALAFNATENAFIIKYEEKEDKSKFYKEYYSKIKVVNKKKNIVIDTLFYNHDKVKFSNSGKYICLISRKKIKILDWKNNKLKLSLKHNLSTSGSNIFQINRNNFIVSGYRNYFKITEDYGNFKVSELKDGIIESVDFKNNKTALLTNNGILFDGKNYKINNQNDYATSISLNEDASKILVNFSNGKTKLLETKTFNRLNTIINFPDNKFLIFNTKGKYYCNIENIDDYLFLTKKNVRYSLSNSTVSLYDPISILSDFGSIENKKEILQALKLRLTKKKQHLEEKKIIKNFYLTNNKQSYTTFELKNKIRIELTEDLKYKFILKINNVTIKDLSYKKISPRVYETEINLSQNTNKVELTCLNKKKKSIPVINEIIYKNQITRNLYLLSIGVSNYKDENYKLNYAHKDALDLSLRYGNVNEKSITRYLNKLYPLSIAKTENKKKDTISGNINSVINFFERDNTIQLSKNGNYWVEAILDPNNNDKMAVELNLYDFKNSTVNKIPLKKGAIFNVKKSNFKSHFNDLGFYYDTQRFKNHKPIHEVYYYDYKTRKTKKTNIHFKIEHAYPINKHDWLSTNQANYYDNSIEIEEETYLSLTLNSRVNNTWNKKKYTLNIKLDDIDSILNVSDDGSLVLIKHYQNYKTTYSLFKLIKEKYIETKVNFNSPYIDSAYFSKDNLKIIGFDTSEETLKLSIYSITDKKIEGKKTKISNFETEQLIGSNYGEPLVLKPTYIEKYYAYYKKHKNINQFLSTLKVKPFSYKNTFVKTLTNTEATNRNILKSANSFFKNSKPEDQVILFLAGHGVLDKKLNYYYAPQDMIFNKPTKKGISYETIVNILNNSQAIQKLLLMDTCHSGNTFDIDNYKIENEKIMPGHRGRIANKLSKNNKITISSIIASSFDNFYSKNGITVFSASSGEDVAYESNNIFNGAFTSAYLEALKDHIKKQAYDLKYSFNQDAHLRIFLQKLDTLLMSKTKNKQKMNVKEINTLAKTIIW